MEFSCEVIGILQWISAGCAAGAAAFWFAASLVRLPPDQIRFDTIDDIVPALRRQSMRNAIGAVLAAAAAGIQAVLIMTANGVR